METQDGVKSNLEDKDLPILEDYNLNKKLYNGKFSSVYLATDKNDDKFIIKQLKISSKKRTKSINLIKNEIIIQRKMLNVNTINLLASFRDGDNVFLVLDYYQEGSLDDLPDKKISKNFYSIFSQIISGLKYIHSLNIIHRDIKFDNIFICKGTIKIGDFGLSAEVEEGENLSYICGTPNYIAPEILFATGYSFPVDIWSVGIMMYKVLFRQFPFNGKRRQNGETVITRDELFRSIQFEKINWYLNNLQIDSKYKIIAGQRKDLVKSLLTKSPNSRASLLEIQNALNR